MGVEILPVRRGAPLHSLPDLLGRPCHPSTGAYVQILWNLKMLWWGTSDCRAGSKWVYCSSGYHLRSWSILIVFVVSLMPRSDNAIMFRSSKGALYLLVAGIMGSGYHCLSGCFVTACSPRQSSPCPDFCITIMMIIGLRKYTIDIHGSYGLVTDLELFQINITSMTSSNWV